ncbi:MAG: HD domain-containing protein [Alphaproteobacteria bacterium]|jgi:predicted HD phosphohydrolase
MSDTRSISEQAEALELRQLREFGDLVIYRSAINKLADGEWSDESSFSLGPLKPSLMGEDPRLPAMPEAPTLIDFFNCRFGPAKHHLLQSALLARQNGLPEKLVLACLLHDISVVAFFRPDHGYWGAQMLEPYVDEEVAWAIRMHQALRFFPDESVGYAYPEAYAKRFGDDYETDPYIRRDYEYARGHKWYMSARLICLNDLYSFDPDKEVAVEEFEDIIGRHFRQPAEGLGNDNTPASHMWRTIRRPSRTL